MDIYQYYSQFITQQFPEYFRTDAETFVEFVRSYYEWMETTGQVTDKSRNLLEYWDIDTTLPEFINYFNNEYLVGVPNNIKADKRLLVKHILDVYRSKGTQRGLRLLFRLLYNEDIDIYIPGEDIFRPSDNIWFVAKYIELEDNSLTADLVGKLIKGSISGASAVVEYYIQRKVNNRIANLLFLSNIIGNFVVGEKVTDEMSFGTVATLNAPKIIGSLNGLTVTGGGQQFSVGEIVRIINGKGIEALGRISATSAGSGTIAVTLIAGGTMFTMNAEPIITKTANTTGSGLTFKVGGLSSINVVSYGTDLIYPQGNTVLMAGNVVSINISSGGTGYSNASVVTFTPRYYVASVTVANNGTSYSNSDTVVFGGSGSGATANVYTDNAGAVLAIDITNPGAGYNTATASITSGTGTGAVLTPVVANTGSGASANVTTNGSGVITAITNLVGGSQYVASPTITVSVGSGANLVANVFTSWAIGGNTSTYLYSKIANTLTFTSGTFGTISSLANVNIGADYEVPPTIAVRDLIHVANITGNVSWSNSSSTVTGVGTSFTYWFAANTVVRLFHDPTNSNNAPAELRIVTAVANDTSMTVDGYPLYTSNAAGKANPAYYLITSIFSPDQLLASNGTIGGFNEFVSASPNFGAGVASAIEVKQSGIGYADNEAVTLYRFGAVSSITINNAGTHYSNGDVVVFAGGSAAYKIATASVLTNGNGAISSFVFGTQGAGYTVAPTVKVQSNTGSGAVLTAVIGGDDTTYSISATTTLGGLGYSLGEWLNNKSFPNADKYIQDSYYYQEYSYEIQSPIPQSSYDTIVRNVYHPAGMEMFGKSVIIDAVGNTSSISANTESVTTF